MHRFDKQYVSGLFENLSDVLEPVCSWSITFLEMSTAVNTLSDVEFSLLVQILQQDFSSFVVADAAELWCDGLQCLLHLLRHSFVTTVQEAAHTKQACHYEWIFPFAHVYTALSRRHINHIHFLWTDLQSTMAPLLTFTQLFSLSVPTVSTNILPNRSDARREREGDRKWEFLIFYPLFNSIRVFVLTNTKKQKSYLV